LGFSSKAVVGADDLVDRRRSKVREFGRSGFVSSAVLEMHPVWIKGEVFRETSGRLTIIKVRNTGPKRLPPAGKALLTLQNPFAVQGRKNRTVRFFRTVAAGMRNGRISH